MTQQILQQALIEHVKGIELGQTLAQHRLETISEEMNGMENGKTVHGAIVYRLETTCLGMSSAAKCDAPKARSREIFMPSPLGLLLRVPIVLLGLICLIAHS